MLRIPNIFVTLAVFMAATVAPAAHLAPVSDFVPSGVNPVSNVVYALSQNGLRQYEEQTGTITTFGFSLQSLVVDPVSNRLYGAVWGQSAVAVVDARTYAVTQVALAATPGAMAVNPVTGKLYVTLPTANSVAVVDLSTLGVTTVPAGASPERISVNAVTNKVYVASPSSDTVTVIDGAANTTSSFVLGPVRSMAVNLATNMLYVLHGAGPTLVPSLSRVDGATLATTTIPVADNPAAIAVNSLTNTIYVGSGGPGNIDGVVTVVDGVTMAKTEIDNGGYLCCNVVVNMTGHEAYVAATGFYCTYCPQPGPTTIIDGDTGAVTQITGGADLMAVNPVTNRVYRSTSYLLTMGISGTTMYAQAGFAPRPNGLVTAIQPLAANTTASLDPKFTFTPSTTSPLPVQRVYYRVDGTEGPWLAATQSGGVWTGRTGPLAPGAHTVHAFAVDARSAIPTAPMVGEMAAYNFTVTSGCTTVTCVELSIAHASAPAQGFTGKDMVFKLTVANESAAAATNVVVQDTLPLGSTFIWATAGCAHSAGVVTCSVGSLAAGSTRQFTIVARPSTPSVANNSASVAATELDPDLTDNNTMVSVPVASSPAANLVLRYRLYSPVTLEHHFTTDLNEYTVLGGQVGTWVQEGTVGQVLDNPGSFGGTEAVPYYRLYDTATRWHHWTTDPNEYYTLGLYANWVAEGVDGYILPTPAPGTTELYRLNYPHLPGLHHWTIDPVEYGQLIANFGWIGEPGAGFVVP